MKNIGLVFYRKGNEPGTLSAQFRHSDYGTGTGIAKGRPSDGFAGQYQVRYFDGNGNFQADRDLSIKKEGGYYLVSWFKDGIMTGEGLCHEISDCLCVGYHEVQPPGEADFKGKDKRDQA